MPVLKVFPSGVTGGFQPPSRDFTGAPLRGAVTGWTVASARRMIVWLMSLNPDALDRSDGYAVTLTLKNCPATADEWVSIRKDFLKRLDRLSPSMVHWVTEWTARGVPHLHLAVYGGVPNMDGRILAAWLGVVRSRDLPCSVLAQSIVPIFGATGWLRYVSKHTSRGVDHYQRQGHPEGWDKTGRLWGHKGDWPAYAPLLYDLEPYQFHEFRRLVRTYQRNQVGRTHGDKRLGRTAGISGWVPDVVAEAFLDLAFAHVPTIIYEDWE